MNFLDYIKGNRKGENAHLIEKESMKDAFLYEAIEGYDSIKDNHAARLEEIKRKLNFDHTEEKSKFLFYKQLAAACLIGIISIGGFLLINTNGSADLHAQNTVGIIEIYVPNNYYKENIAIIAQNNTTQFKKYRPEILKLSISEDMVNTPPSKKDIQMLAANNVSENSPITIYQPEDIQKAPVSKKKRDLSEINVLAASSKTRISAKMSTNETISADISTLEPTHIEATKLEVESSSKTTHTIEIAEPIIGFEKYDEYIIASMRRPKDAQCRNVSGSVIVAFKINEEGSPIELKIFQSLCKSCDKEAIRLVKNGPKWKGTKVAVVTIKF